MNPDRTQGQPWVVIVGGFLGAGKTSLIMAGCEMLAQRGMRTAVVLNDQGDDLVDTRHARQRGIASSEVTGGCFCCRFTNLVSAVHQLHSYAPDVIFAEPVGSCTDLTATVLRPLREEFSVCRVAPLTVLLDPTRYESVRTGRTDIHVEFLMRKQLQEADLVCFSKADLHSTLPELPGAPALRVSARTGVGVREWLDRILIECDEAGRRVLEIDYDRYAQAEASLAWLNLHMEFHAATPLPPALVVGPIMDRLDEALTEADVSIAHLKLIDSSPSGWIKASICKNGDIPEVEGNLDAESTRRHDLLLNLRATGTPDQVRTIVEKEIGRLKGVVADLQIHSFAPSPPKPERRLA